LRKIGIIGAMEEEITAIKNKMKIQNVRSISSLEFYVGILHGKEIVLVRAGIGKVNAAICTQILIDCFSIEAIINVGVAGGLGSNLKIGDIVISDEAVQHDVDATGFGYELGIIPRMKNSFFKSDRNLINIAKKASETLSIDIGIYTGRILTGDQFISSIDKKKELEEKFNGLCAEMEGGAIAQTCYLNNIPFVIIRSISDNADDSAEVNFEEFSQLAAANSCKMIDKIIEIM